MEKEKLFCKGGGCTAKLGAGILSRILSKLPQGPEDENLLVGYDSKDDAAAYKISDDIALYKPLISFLRWSMTLTLLGKSLLQMH